MIKGLKSSITVFLFFLFSARIAQAFSYTPEFPIPGLPKTISDPAVYIRTFFNFGLVLVGFLAVAAIAIGGVMYMVSGTIGKVEKAKEIIYGALIGVILLLCSYLLLQTIDPSLLILSPYRPPNAAIPNQQITKQQALQELNQKYAQPNTDKCNDPKSCTEAMCGPGSLNGGIGKCAAGEIWITNQLTGVTCGCSIPMTAY